MKVKVLFYIFLMLLSFLLSAYLTTGFILKNQKTVSCPDIKGLTVYEAEALLRKKGLNLKVSRSEKRKDVPKGVVLFQQPEPNALIKEGRTVHVTVSLGPEMVVVPNLKGLSLRVAEDLLSEKNLKIQKKIFVPSKIEDRILAHVPAAGERVPEGGGITVIVGMKPPEFYVVPDVTGSDFNQIIEELESKGIDYKVVYRRGERSQSEGRITLEKRPGTILSPNEVLVINVFLGG